MIKHSTNLPKTPEARAGKVPRRKAGDYMNENKIRQEPQDVTALVGQVKGMTPVQLAQTIALLNMAAAVFAGFATIEAASRKS